MFFGAMPPANPSRAGFFDAPPPTNPSREIF
jgi:hypothetical protein